jgi:ParB/RepB/Spo0J family partition protein
MPKRSSKTTPEIPRTELSTVPFDRIHRSTLNPRSDFPAKGIRDLAATIEEDGLLEALMVRPAPDRKGQFEIAAGERRFRALEHLREQGRIPADWPVPVQIRELDDQELLTLALVENLLREDLHPLDEAFAYKRLVDEGVRTAEIARRVKRTQRHVQLRLQLTTLDPKVQEAFRASEINLAQARILATAPPERHVPAFEHLRKYSGVFDDPKNLMALLAKDSFPQDRAEFSPRAYKGPTLRDPETGRRYYLDLAQVLRLQMKEAERLREEILAEQGLQAVEILSGETSQIWTHYREAPGKPTHGVILVSPDGAISVYDQLVPVSADTPRARAGEPEGAPVAEAREPSAPARLLVAAQRIRNSAVQQAVGDSPSAALRLLVVGLLQRPETPETGLAFGPSKAAPPVAPEPGLAGEVASRLVEALGAAPLPSPEKTTAPLDRISQPQDARRLFEALGEVPHDELLSLLSAVVAARVGSTALRGDDAPLVAHLARELRATPDPTLWLRADYLEHYPKARLIRLALDSGAVPGKEAGSLEDLTRPQIIDRILESNTRDEDYLPPELSFGDS